MTADVPAGRAFVDTNVLVCAVDAADESKRSTAIRLLADRELSDLVVSTQVLAEFYVVATKKLAMPSDVAATYVEGFANLVVDPVDDPLVRAAMRRSVASQLSYWDAQIVECALRTECEVLLTEDLQHGADFDGLRVANPFS